MPSRNPKKRGNNKDFMPTTPYPRVTKKTKVLELLNN